MTVPVAILSPAQFSAGTGGKVAPDDPRVPALLDGAHAGIRRYCRWHIAPILPTTDRFLDVNGGYVLQLPTLNLVSIEALSVRDEASDTDPWTVLTQEELDDLEWSEDGEIRRSVRWPRRYRGVKISFTHGFDFVPDVVQIIQQVVANAISSPLGATTESAGALSVSWSTTAPGVSGGMSLLDRDYAVLSQYRLPPRMGT